MKSGLGINQDHKLEEEADIMGSKAEKEGRNGETQIEEKSQVVSNSANNKIIQMATNKKGKWTLKYGNSNNKNDVIVLQKYLVINGYLNMPKNSVTQKPVPFGFYGKLTKQAVTEFQRKMKLKVDGIVGTDTWNAMQLPWNGEINEPNREDKQYQLLLNANNEELANMEKSNGGNSSSTNTTNESKKSDSITPDKDNKSDDKNYTTLLWPTDSTRVEGDSSKFGDRIHPITKQKKFHNGIDIGAKNRGVEGDPVYAAADGKVVKVAFQFDEKSKTGAGYYIVIESNINGKVIQTKYLHLMKNSTILKVGDKVKAGDIIAKMGNTGGSTSAHLHFSIMEKNSKGNFEYVDPLNYEYTYK